MVAQDIARQVELGVTRTIDLLGTAWEVEQVVREVMSVDESHCSITGIRHRLRSACSLLHRLVCGGRTVDCTT